MNSSTPTQNATGWPSQNGCISAEPDCATEVISEKFIVPLYWNSRNIPSRKPKSPMRLVMNAFLPASALALSVYQKPMSR